MNSITGKSTGIALLMAAALLAALFAMGVFSAGSVGAQVEPDDDQFNSLTVTPDDDDADTTETDEITFDAATASYSITVDSNWVSLAIVATGGAGGSEWGTDAEFSAMVDGTSLSDSDSEDNTGTFTVNLKGWSRQDH